MAATRIPPHYSCVLFDLDGVLFETRSLALRARERVEGANRSPARYRAEYARLLRREGRPADPDVPDVLRHLANRGIALGVVTSSPSVWAAVLLDRFGCRSCFGCLIGAEAVRCPKPDPEGLRLALQRLGKSADEALYVGHEQMDAEAAQRAGIAFARARWADPKGSAEGAELEGMRQLLTWFGVSGQEPGER